MVTKGRRKSSRIRAMEQELVVMRDHMISLRRMRKEALGKLDERIVSQRLAISEHIRNIRTARKEERAAVKSRAIERIQASVNASRGRNNDPGTTGGD